ncbi:hypothetical protein N0V85_005626 [Neurospora sp. IMI 360204]|nr:hypothetical protein N0V85_005626 [Neurospora sp. IMI 360204]
MGKPSPPIGVSGDAISLHTQPGQHSHAVPLDGTLDTDAPELNINDLPPLYDEINASGSSSRAPLLPSDAPPYMPPYINHPNNILPPGDWVKNYKRDEPTGTELYLEPRLDSDPKFLQKHIELWAKQPLRPFVRIHGTHKRRKDITDPQNGRRKNDSEQVTDFDLHIELTPYLYSDVVSQTSLMELRTAENDEKVRRGTVLRKRAPGASRHIEVGLAEKPTLAEWCHRYCASHAGLKCLTLQRRVVGFDDKKVVQKLTDLVRATNYRGSLEISFPKKDEYVHVYNDCKTNRWRTTWWIIWLCMFSLMFIFTWPYLFLRTKRFETVFADWHFSVMGADGQRKYASTSEDQWYNMWGRAINRAVMEKRQCTLDQQDLLNSQEGQQETFGHPVVDGAASFVRAGVNAMNAVNRSLGWGYDDF